MGRKQSQSESVWRGRLARFRKSNLSVAEFCREEGVSDPTFYRWRQRLEQGQQKAKPVRHSEGRGKPLKSSLPFVPVNVPGSMMVEVEFPNGVRIRLPAANAEALRVAILTGSEVCREAR